MARHRHGAVNSRAAGVLRGSSLLTCRELRRGRFEPRPNSVGTVALG